MIRKNNVKEALKQGQTVIGTFIKMTDASTVEIVGMSGFDFFVIDSEHVAYNRETVTSLVRASDISQIVPIVRVRENKPVEVMQALDMGALGIHIPNVDTYEEALMAVRSARYAPLGDRGFAPTHRAAGYGMMDKETYIQLANEEVLTILHCETLEAVKNLDQILMLDELDVIFIGPMDLSQSMGKDIMGKSDHKELLAVIDTIIEKVIKAGKVVGTVAGNVEAAKALMKKGVRYIPISSDQGMIASMSQCIVKGLKEGSK